LPLNRTPPFLPPSCQNFSLLLSVNIFHDIFHFSWPDVRSLISHPSREVFPRE
jgi:hypothetical protein